ncbi:unnamed protein product [Adineta steineri]|uniref:Uncharacterized protein n=1 Tax=Adineta steineri TaxID=433720 RepID=A0A818SDK9_9BILA|nr:unnamed protein product [Adineta steineri]CAF3665778.1 unnamed protein product [Adineta steineri]
MNRSFKNFYWLKSIKHSYIPLIIVIIVIIRWTIVIQNFPSSSCQQINIYGQTNQKRCYPLLVNFGHECCAKAQSDNCETGLAFGIKHCVKLNMDIFDSDKNFIRRNRDILDRSRGAGYWIWKPYIIWHELYGAREGDIIVYSDAAVNFTAHINNLLPLMKKQDILIFHQESAYTKRDTFILLNADDPTYVDSMASVASYVFVRKSTQSFSFISEWLTYAQDRRALTDDLNELGMNNSENFIDHRHDQSILGILATKWKLRRYTDPSQFGENCSRPFPTIFWHHRLKE